MVIDDNGKWTIGSDELTGMGIVSGDGLQNMYEEVNWSKINDLTSVLDSLMHKIDSTSNSVQEKLNNFRKRTYEEMQENDIDFPEREKHALEILKVLINSHPTLFVNEMVKKAVEFTDALHKELNKDKKMSSIEKI